MTRRANLEKPLPLDELLIKGANASVVVFVVSSTLAVGLGLTVPQILAPLRNRRLVVLSLLANFVLVPAIAIGLARVFGLDEPLGWDCCWSALAGGAPFLLKLADLAKGDMPFAVGLMVVLMVITVGYMPIVLPLVLDGRFRESAQHRPIAHPADADSAGGWARACERGSRRPPLASGPWSRRVSSISMVFVVVLTTAAHVGAC